MSSLKDMIFDTLRPFLFCAHLCVFNCGLDFIITDPRPSVHRRNTVKELLMLRRQQTQNNNLLLYLFQKWKCSEEDNIPEHKLKYTRSEAFPNDSSLQPLTTPLAVNPNIPDYVLNAAPGNSLFTSQQLQYPSLLQGQAAPTVEVKMTLFNWQIQQEAMKMEGVSPEQLNMQDADGDTFLHIAVAQGRRALAYVLAAKMGLNGSLDIKEHNGQTALQIAAATNQHLIVSDLLVCGAKVNTQDLWGRSPLHVCAEKGYFPCLQSICRTLTETGQPLVVEMFNYDGLTPLHAAVLSHNAVIKDLRSLDKSTTCMATERQVKRRYMYLECIKTLLHMGASCETKERKSGRTCLHMAAEEANMELLHLFLEQPSFLSLVKQKTFSGNTALHIVSSLQNHKAQVEAVRLLMRKGADPGSRNSENELPSQLVPEGPTGEKVRRILKGKYVHA
uniref:Uncharacterized protein n=1 Tax=Sphaeramia orbicularis TaxID=375764 RepID=A0A673BS33_9TELE